MIDGLLIKPLKVIRDERGQVMHMMRADDGVFKCFGEVYFSVINPGVIKGWKRHLRKTQHFAVPRGDIRLVIYDDRLHSQTKDEIQEILVGEKDYKLIRIPPMVWYGFACEGKDPAMIVNCCDIAHDPAESEIVPLEDLRIPYSWKGRL
jgi:dTDP-4-dehydrorhamnose 3,5-epimerase